MNLKCLNDQDEVVSHESGGPDRWDFGILRCQAQEESEQRSPRRSGKEESSSTSTMMGKIAADEVSE